MATKKTTLKDIAEKLNVMVATVSRALNDHPDISQKIKEQVRFLAETLHYRPNSFALHLRRQRSGMIGVIVPKIIHHFSSTIISGILHAAHEKNYEVLICESGDSADGEKENINALINSGVDGLLVSLSNHTFSEDYFTEIQNDGMPIVYFDKVPLMVAGHKITTNDYIGAINATEHLIQEGYKNIAHLKGQPGSRNSLPRYQGYCDALIKHNFSVKNEMIAECKFCSEEGYELTKAMLQKKNKPDALFAINDETAIGALAALNELKIRVPEQFGVVGFCNSKVAQYVQPALSSVAQFGNKIGLLATNLLIECITDDTKERISAGYQSHVLDAELIVRASSNKTSNALAKTKHKK